MTFEAAGGLDGGWQPYFVTPLLMVGAILLLELGIVGGSRTARRLAMLAPLALLLTAFPGHGSTPLQARFVAMLCDSIGSPAQWTVFLLAGFYLWAWFRRVRFAEAGLIGCMLLMTIVDHRTVSLATLTTPHIGPIWAIALMQIGFGAVYRCSHQWLAGCLLAIGLTAYQFSHTPLVDHFGYFPVHAAVIFTLVAGLIFRDRFARGLRASAPVVVPLLAALAACTYHRVFPNLPGWVHLQYIGLLTLCGLAYWRQITEVSHLAGSLTSAACGCVAAGRQCYGLLHDTMLEKGLHWIAWGLVFLAVAALISLAKAGLLWKSWSTLRQLNNTLRNVKPLAVMRLTVRGWGFGIRE